MANLFVYGTLLYPQVWRQLVKREYPSSKALLHQYQRRRVVGEAYPGLIHRKGHCVEGKVYFGVTPQDLRRLDHFEGKYYERRTLSLTLPSGETVRADTYQVRNRYRHRLSNLEWTPIQFEQNALSRFAEFLR